MKSFPEIYFDNASTSFPKPPEVMQAIQYCLENFAANPGRGTHILSEKAEELVYSTRQKLTKIIGGEKPEHLIFTTNATHSLNLVIIGMLKKGGHVLACSYSHNSVIRPLEELYREKTASFDIIDVDACGEIDLEEFQKKIKSDTRLVICNHASNVIGVISHAAKIAAICKENNIPFLLDCTQTLGYVPINLSQMPFDFLVATGHKTLLGPTGISFLYIKNPDLLDPWVTGGSGGTHSISSYHPRYMPHKFEAGTINTVGIAGLKGALDYIARKSFYIIRKEAMELIEYAWNCLKEIPEVTLYGTGEMDKKVPIISFTIKGILPDRLAQYYSNFGICIRFGLHCAPWVHKTIGTLPTGTVRLSLGHFNRKEEINYFIQCTKELIARN